MLAAKSSNRELRSPKVAQANLAGHEPPHRPGRMRDRDAKQQALIMAALKLFASKGYEATTTREIATCAGCAEGLIHRYFRGKAGLLSALIRYRISKEVADLTHHIRPAKSLKDEYLQLVDWAVQHMWADREFLRVALPQAVLDPNFGRALRRVGPQQMGLAIAQRLRKFKECTALSATELDALIQLVTVLGFMFGFMRPAVLRQDRESAARSASRLAKLVVRSLPSSMYS
jgi:TetR/AcrR family transcriptional regulator, regulator of cefoperazone and chloramphenicol sensitivity